MATYGSGLKISNFISVDSSGTATYTVPAASYAIVQVASDTSPATITINISGNGISIASPPVTNAGQIHLGPGQTISASNGGHHATIFGILFSN